MLDAASLNFVPRDANLSISGTLESSGTRRAIAMRVSLAHGEDLRLPDDRSLREILWAIYFVEGSAYNEGATTQGSIGLIRYNKEQGRLDTHLPESCYINVALRPELFSSLLTAVQSGRVPDQITVWVKGLKYGWEPDGSGKIWDTTAMPLAYVSEVGFNIPLFERRDDPEVSTEAAPAERLPPTAEDIRSLERTVVEMITPLRRESAGRWTALFVLIFVTIILLYLRR
jgi:hypothetical protein